MGKAILKSEVRSQKLEILMIQGFPLPFTLSPTSARSLLLYEPTSPLQLCATCPKF